jgi:hypothetical protein
MKIALLALVACVGTLRAQQPALPLVETAVQTELAADRDDHSAWVYLDHDVTPDHDILFLVAESPAGTVKRKLEDRGHPLDPAQLRQEDARLHAFVHDSARMQKQRKDEKHDDDQATNMLKLLPRAFLWTVQSEEGDRVTLAFRPNPGFTPQTLEAKVLCAMAGEIVVFRPQHRIEIIRGSLVNDVTFGWGVLGRLRKGGSFFVERGQVAPGHWQITASRVHIDGRALLFKTIGEQEDETKSGFHPSTAQTLEEAYAEVSAAP